MYIRRPMCLYCIVFLVTVYIYTLLFPLETSVDADVFNKRRITFSGEVTKKQEKDGVLKVYLEDVAIAFNNSRYKSTGVVADFLLMDSENPARTNEYSPSDIKIGMRILGNGLFNAFDRAKNDGEFDMRKYYAIRNVDGCIKKTQLVAISAEYSPYREWLSEVSNKAAGIFATYMSKQDAGIMTALVLGDKAELDTDIKELYSRAGIAHVLSLSGLHIATVGLFLMTLLRKTGLPMILSSAVAACVMISYALLTGFSTSTARALVMFLAGVLARICKRSYDILSAAAFSAVTILVSNPYYVLDSGFLLSFGAIMGIALVLPVVERLSKREDKAYIKEPEGLKNPLINKLHMLLEGIRVTFAVTVMTLPISAFSFFQISIFSAVANLFVVPLMGVVLAVGILGVLIGTAQCGFAVTQMNKMADLCAFAASATLKIAHVIFMFYEKLASIITSVRYNIWIVGRPKEWQIAAYYFILTGILCVDKIDQAGQEKRKNSTRYPGILHNKITHLIKMKYSRLRSFADADAERDYSASCRHLDRRRPWVIRLVYITMWATSLVILTVKPNPGVKISNLSVGQGDCAVIFGKDTPVIIIDGGSSDRKEVGKYTLMPVLKSNGISKVDYIFISHFDTDHVSAIIELLEDATCGIDVKRIVVSDVCAEYCLKNGDVNFQKVKNAAKERKTGIYTISKGDTIGNGDITITSLWPNIDENSPENSHFDVNENSMVLEIDYGKENFTALFTGDIGAESEKKIIVSDGFKKMQAGISYLKVPHHGSKSSSSAAFIEKIVPDIAIISVGENNSYGHPHPETINRIKKCVPASKILRTDKNGQITVSVEKSKVTIDKFAQ